MHQHECRYCREKLICDENAAECFRTYIVCNECWFDHDLKHYLLFVFLLAVALAATVFLFREMKKPAFAAPVSLIKKTTTGEKYYENERKTN